MGIDSDSEQYKNKWRSDGGIVILLSVYLNSFGGNFSVDIHMDVNIGSNKNDFF